VRYAFGYADVDADKYADRIGHCDGNFNAHLDADGFAYSARGVPKPGTDLHDAG
jgi:hypothetical protein